MGLPKAWQPSLRSAAALDAHRPVSVLLNVGWLTSPPGGVTPRELARTEPVTSFVYCLAMPNTRRDWVDVNGNWPQSVGP
jgi:hypothetical protein